MKRFLSFCIWAFLSMVGLIMFPANLLCSGARLVALIGLWLLSISVVRTIMVLKGSYSRKSSSYFLIFSGLVVPLILLPFSIDPERPSKPSYDCGRNLSALQSAVTFWASENHKTNGSAVRMTDLLGEDGLFRTGLFCPSGGGYTLGPVGQPPRCTLESEGHKADRTAIDSSAVSAK